MQASRERSVFVSYSSRDIEDVRGIIGLLRAVDVNTFFNEDSIEKGVRWKGRLRQALFGCRKVVVFWSTHAADSKYVPEEYETAILISSGLSQFSSIRIRCQLS